MLPVAEWARAQVHVPVQADQGAPAAWVVWRLQMLGAAEARPAEWAPARAPVRAALAVSGWRPLPPLAGLPRQA